MILFLFYWRFHLIFTSLGVKKILILCYFHSVWGRIKIYRIENARNSEPILFYVRMLSLPLFCVSVSVLISDCYIFHLLFLFAYVWRRCVRMKRSVYCAKFEGILGIPFILLYCFCCCSGVFCIFHSFSFLQKVRCYLLCWYDPFWIRHCFEYDWLALFGSFKI